ISKGGHFICVFKAKTPAAVERAVQHPDAQLGQLVEFDLVAVPATGVVEPRELRHEPVDQPLAAVIEPRRAGSHEVVEMTAITLLEHLAYLVEDLYALVEHGKLDVAAEDVLEGGPGDLGEIAALEQRNALVERPLHRGQQGLGIRCVPAL